MHYEISLSQQQMHHESVWIFPTNKQKETNKLNNRKQTASLSPNSHIPSSRMCPKTIARETVRYATENSDQNNNQIPKRKQTSPHICPDRLSATKKGKASQRERAIFFRIKFAGLQTNNETHLTLLFPVAERCPNKERRWKGFVNIRIVLEPTYRQGRLKVQALPLHSHHDGSPCQVYSRTRHRSPWGGRIECQHCRWTVRCPEVYYKNMATEIPEGWASWKAQRNGVMARIQSSSGCSVSSWRAEKPFRQLKGS